MSIEAVIEKKKVSSKKIQEPKKWKVIICNDDQTPMDFVIAMLISIFKHNHDQAYDLTMEIHNQGSGVAGLYSYEVAEQKALDGINLSRANGWPLLIKIEQE